MHKPTSRGLTAVCSANNNGREMPRKRTYVRVTISLPEPEMKQVDRLAKELTIPRSAMIRIAVLDYLRRRPKP